jgi:antitoxin (DNA-binding transcriptional repressor) of toxin-antitoxin stability system
MHTLTADDLTSQPQRLIDDARRGEVALVTSDGEPVLLAVPLDSSAASQPMRIELAVRLFDDNQISLGVADSGPLIALARLDLLRLPAAIFAGLTTPCAGRRRWRTQGLMP